MQIVSSGSLEELFIVVFAVLVNVAFLTLLERKVLGLAQVRIGPNKVGAWGLLQPGADAIKLFTKMTTLLGPMNKMVFFLSPVLALGLSILFLILISGSPGGSGLSLALLYFLMLLSLNVYPLMGAGWASNSKYATLGGLRGVAQTLAYEISLSFLMVSVLYVWSSLSLKSGEGGVGGVPPLMYTISGLVLWCTTCVAELNRTPFDFAEGESELISGFNIEYGAVKFALIFMAEYMMIYFLSILSMVLFLGSGWLNSFVLLAGLGLAFLIIWLRATLPRFRYDLLMQLNWKHILPWALGGCQLMSGLALSVRS